MRYFTFFITRAIAASLGIANTFMNCDDQGRRCMESSDLATCAAVYQVCAVACIKTYDSCSKALDPSCGDTLVTCLGPPSDTFLEGSSTGTDTTNVTDLPAQLAKRAPAWYFPDQAQLCRNRGEIMLPQSTTFCPRQSEREFSYSCVHPNTNAVASFTGVCDEGYYCQQVNNDGTAPRAPIESPYSQSRAMCVLSTKKGSGGGRGETSRVCAEPNNPVRKFFGKVYATTKEKLQKVIYVKESKSSGTTLALAGQSEKALEYDLSYDFDYDDNNCIRAIVIAGLTILWAFDWGVTYAGKIGSRSEHDIREHEDMRQG